MFRWLKAPLANFLTDGYERVVQEAGVEEADRLHALGAKWLKVGLVLVIILSFSLISTAVSWVLRFLPALDALEGILSVLAGFATSLTALATVGVLITKRVQQQIAFDWTLAMGR